MGCRRAAGCRGCGGVAVRLAVGSRVSRQPPSWTARWWARQSRARLARSVGPPWSQWRRWWASHQARGRYSRGRHSRRRGRPGRGVGRVGRPGWSGRPPGLGGGATSTGGSRAIAARSRAPAPPPRPGRCVPVAGWRWVVDDWLLLGAGVVAGVAVSLGWRVTSTRVTALSQASRRQASGSRGPASPTSAHPNRSRPAEEAVQVNGHGQLGADPRRSGGAGLPRGCGGPVP